MRESEPNNALNPERIPAKAEALSLNPEALSLNTETRSEKNEQSPIIDK